MKKIASFFRDGTAEEWLGRILISVVIIPVVINILNREFFTHYSLTLESIALLAYVGIGYAMLATSIRRTITWTLDSSRYFCHRSGRR